MSVHKGRGVLSAELHNEGHLAGGALGKLQESLSWFLYFKLSKPGLPPLKALLLAIWSFVLSRHILS